MSKQSPSIEWSPQTRKCTTERLFEAKLEVRRGVLGTSVSPAGVSWILRKILGREVSRCELFSLLERLCHDRTNIPKTSCFNADKRDFSSHALIISSIRPSSAFQR